MILWKLDLQLHVQSVPMTNKLVSSNIAQTTLYYKFVNYLRQIVIFLRVLRFPRLLKLTATISME